MVLKIAAGVLILLLAVRCCRADNPALSAGLPVELEIGTEEVHLGATGNVWSDGRWRADLERVADHNLEFFRALNQRHLDRDLGFVVWTQPVWGRGWAAGKKEVRYPRTFTTTRKQICRGSYCQWVDTFKFKGAGNGGRK